MSSEDCHSTLDFSFSNSVLMLCLSDSPLAPYLVCWLFLLSNSDFYSMLLQSLLLFCGYDLSLQLYYELIVPQISGALFPTPPARRVWASRGLRIMWVTCLSGTQAHERLHLDTCFPDENGSGQKTGRTTLLAFKASARIQGISLHKCVSG